MDSSSNTFHYHLPLLIKSTTMVTGIEEQTALLNEYDMKLVKQFINSFRSRVGRDNKITSSEIEMSYRNRGEKVPGAKIRGIVHYIRFNETITINNRRHFLISDNTGYWLSSDKSEILKFAESLQQRAGAILSVKAAVEKFMQGKAANKFIEDAKVDLFQDQDKANS